MNLELRKAGKEIIPVVFFLSSIASAATTDYRILIDRDNDSSTGCTVAGMLGIETVLTTTVDPNADRVLSVTQQDCSGTALSASLTLDSVGWPSTFNGATGIWETTLATGLSASAFSLVPIPEPALLLVLGAVLVVRRRLR